jgi:hypothetical protein
MLSHSTPWWRLGGEELMLLLILDLGIRWFGGQSHAPATLYPRGNDHWYPFNVRLVGYRAGLDEETARKVFYLWWGSNPGRIVRSETLFSMSCLGFCSVSLTDMLICYLYLLCS